MAGNNYMDIYQALKTRITDGELRAHETLPSENVLCTEFGVSRNTVRRALGLLIDEALIFRKPGVGSSVAARPKDRPRMPMIGLDLGGQAEKLPFYTQLLQTGMQNSSAKYGAQLCLLNRESMTAEIMESLSGFISVGSNAQYMDLLRELDRKSTRLNSSH